MKAKQLLLFSAMLLGSAATAIAGSVTVKFTGVNDAYKLFTVVDEDEEEYTPSSDTYVIEYDGSSDYWLTIEAGYKMQIECTTSGIPASSYSIEDQSKMMGMEPGQFIMLELTEGCDGATFTCTAEELSSASSTINFKGVKNPFEHLTVKAKSGNKETTLPVTSNTLTASYGGSTLLIFDAEEGYLLNIVCDNPDLTDQYNTGDYNLIDVGSRNPKLFTPGTHWELYLYAGANGATFTCTVTKEGEPEPTPENSVTINFTGAEDAYKYVSVMDEDENDISVDSAAFVLEYDESMEIIISAQEGYHLTIACDDKMLTNEYSTGDYYLEDFNPTHDPEKEWDLAVYPGANGATFTCTVTKDEEPQPTPENSVTINFTGIEDAYKYVSVMDEDEKDITVDSASFVLEYGESVEIIISAEEGYLLTIACDDTMLTNEYSTGDYFLQDFNPSQDPEKGWDLVAYPGADGATFTATVKADLSGIVANPAEEDMTIYNLLGVKIFENGKKTDIKGLAPGLYIINGKKVAISK